MSILYPGEDGGAPSLTLEEMLRRVMAALRDNDLAAAESLCRTVLATSPECVAAQNALAVALKRLGTIGAEIEMLKARLDDAGDDTHGLALLGELQRVSGDAANARGSLAAAARLDPGNATLVVNLGRAHAAAGAFADAEAAFRRATEIEPGLAIAHYFLGETLRHLGRTDDAIAALEAAIAADPTGGPASLPLATLLYARRRPDRRRADLERALELVTGAGAQGARTLADIVLSGKILIELGRFDDAIATLEPALDFPKKHPDLYVALSVAYAHGGKGRQAQLVSRRLMREFPVATRRGRISQANILVLECLTHTAFVRPFYGLGAYANANAIAALPAERLSLSHVYVDGITRDQLPRLADRHHAIFNNVANAELSLERRYGTKIRAIATETGLPVVNHPDQVERTTRDGNYRLLDGIDRLIVPKTLAFEGDKVATADLVRMVAEAFAFPVVVRPAGTHRASSLTRAEDEDALRAALAEIGPRRIYVAQYHESRHTSGKYVMYRGVFVGGRFLPARMYVSEGWLVSGPLQRAEAETAIAASAALRDEERAWLKDPAAHVGAGIIDAFKEIDGRLGLDCYGFDFGIAGDGRAILFEANAAMNILSIRRHVPQFPYLKDAAADITEAFEGLLLARAHGA